MSEDAQAPSRPGSLAGADIPQPARRRAIEIACALLVIAAATALCYAEVWRAGISEVVPIAQVVPPDSPNVVYTRRADATYEAWLAARHAHTLLRRPWRLFDTEHCAPEQNSLTYGIPMIAMGMLAIPASLVTREPIAVYNAALALQSAVAAIAMFALVSAWTGRRAAGLVAALLFAFHPVRLANITHPTEWDISWTALALLFSERFFRRGRWRDALAFAASTAMQIAASFYQLLAAAFLTPPFAAWLLLRRGVPRPPLLRLTCALALVALAAALVLGPYLAAREAEQIHGRMFFAYAMWSRYAPGGTLFPGFVLLALAAFGLAAPRRLALPELVGDPRLALFAGAVIVAFVAAGFDTAMQLSALGLPVPPFDPYRALARWLPGLDTVRGVGRLTSGVELVLCILAGAGAAALLRLAGRRAPAVGAALVLAALLACFGAPPLGIERSYAWQLEAIRPSAEQIAFFEQLALMGDGGPILELPVDGTPGGSTLVGPQRILLSAWHGRRTSACFGSFFPPEREELRQLAARLPDREAARALRGQGFTTVGVHHPGGMVRALPVLRPFDRASAEPEPALRLLQHVASMSAYQLLPEPAGAAP